MLKTSASLNNVMLILRGRVDEGTTKQLFCLLIFCPDAFSYNFKNCMRLDNDLRLPLVNIMVSSANSK